jgi:organic hydroperoxide reductase OsmC/OhrA
MSVDTPVDNGVNVEALLGARAALADAPDLAKFQWRATTSWVRGTHSQSSVQSFYGLGDEQEHTTTFTYDADHPLQFAAEDNGSTPVEYVLVALGSCLTAGVAAIAQQRKIQLNSVSATIAADIDADASPEDIEALVAQSQKRSAVFDVLTRPTNISVAVN